MTAEPSKATDPVHDDEPYDSAEDEDFQLDDAQDDGDITSDDDNEAEPASKRRKTETTEAGMDGPVELDSGDEATIRKVKSKKQKKQTGKKSEDDDDDDEDDVDFDDDDEGGPGGFVRTRAMRMHMQEERKPLAKIDGATVDVNALWARMNAPGADNGSTAPVDGQDSKEGEQGDGADDRHDTPSSNNQQPQTKYREETIKIKRTYKFAGEWITEEKVVPKDSAEARIFLAGENGAEATAEAEDSREYVNLRRPLRKISRFDPNPTGSIKKSWEKQPITQEEKARGPKINTVEKSRLDWAAYVDDAGIKDELRTHSKAKEGFLDRMDFLDRVGANREEEARNARLKGL